MVTDERASDESDLDHLARLKARPSLSSFCHYEINYVGA